MIDGIKVVAFDADDTLWENEAYFQEFEANFCKMVGCYVTSEQASAELLRTEMRNLHLYGYGAKGMMLCMIETVCKVAKEENGLKAVQEILKLGHGLLQTPVEILPGVETVLSALTKKYQLVLATKGDLLDQERKIRKSGIQHYFDRIEVMSDKTLTDYQKMIDGIGCKPQEFLMIGNSIKSDIEPVLAIGGRAVHIPHHITWQYETQIDDSVSHEFFRLEKIEEVLNYL